MDSADLQVLSSAIAWRCSGHGVTLATVVRTWGSAPRPPGAWLAIREDGQVVGSVSGGCVEEDLITRVRERRIEGALPSVLTYGVTKEEAERFGLPCGGTLQLVIEPHPDLGSLQALLARLERRETVARTLDMGTGSLTLAEAKRSDALQFDATRLTTIHGPRYRLLIIGAGQLSRYLAQMAGALDYQVVVCDPREEYNLSWDVPGADLVTTMPDDTVLAMRLDACSAVVALTHDPKLDDMALLEALKSRAFYVGALGSRANNAKRRDRLREHFDLTESELARLHGPVGLPIGSRTPPEIAVSILAEITGVKNGATYAAARVPSPHSAAEQAAGCGVP
jgi:xanthine dehydrogenase accessory factor